MANNRMFLIHKPTKIGVSLGKRMGWGWYGAPEKQTLDSFYEYLSTVLVEEPQDDFILAMEDCSDSNCFGDWQYTGKEESGFPLFELKEKK